jgi:biopolymer transport protein ExbB
MNSFVGISKANTTNLAVVAPGIAEALLATAIGLVAAIPAVVIYNLFARSIASYRAMLADASTEVMRHLSRDLDRQLFLRDNDDERVVMMRHSAE